MPLYLLAGATDHITPPDQVFAIAGFASTPPELVRRHVTTGGHLGLFMGHEALREHWPPILAEVVRHSTSRARPHAQPRKRSRSGDPSVATTPAVKELRDSLTVTSPVR
jgi:poly(3-hydroxyalkanoate) synthetase